MTDQGRGGREHLRMTRWLGCPASKGGLGHHLSRFQLCLPEATKVLTRNVNAPLPGAACHCINGGLTLYKQFTLQPPLRQGALEVTATVHIHWNVHMYVILTL